MRKREWGEFLLLHDEISGAVQNKDEEQNYLAWVRRN